MTESFKDESLISESADINQLIESNIIVKK